MCYTSISREGDAGGRVGGLHAGERLDKGGVGDGHAIVLIDKSTGRAVVAAGVRNVRTPAADGAVDHVARHIVPADVGDVVLGLREALDDKIAAPLDDLLALRLESGLDGGDGLGGDCAHDSFEGCLEFAAGGGWGVGGTVSVGGRRAPRGATEGHGATAPPSGEGGRLPVGDGSCQWAPTLLLVF